MPALSLSQCATLACLLEATAPKVGNVHRGADFVDLTFTDFAVSAALVGPIVERAADLGVGATILEAVRATRAAVPSNTNLGILLLLGPLAAVPRDQPLREGVHQVLQRLTASDSRDVYEAIRLATPGGLGKVDSMDVRDAAPPSLLDAMRAAEQRDLIARQYTTGFRDVLEVLTPELVADRARGMSLTDAIVATQVRWLAREPDSLIARKGGVELARRVSEFAAAVLRFGEPGTEDYYRGLADFDFWLRADGHRRNPGTTADLIAAALFAALRDDLLPPPWR